MTQYTFRFNLSLELSLYSLALRGRDLAITAGSIFDLNSISFPPFFSLILTLNVARPPDAGNCQNERAVLLADSVTNVTPTA